MTKIGDEHADHVPAPESLKADPGPSLAAGDNTRPCGSISDYTRSVTAFALAPISLAALARNGRTYAKDMDFVFPSVRLKGKKPLSASIMVQKYLRPAAVKAGVIKEGEKLGVGFHNFRHALATALVKLKVDAKTVQGILRHEDFGTTMQLYAQSDMESMRDAQGKFLEQLLGDRIHPLTEKVQ